LSQESPSGVGSYLLLAGGMAVFGSGTPISKIVTDAFPVFVASGARMLLAAAALVPLMVLLERRSDRRLEVVRSQPVTGCASAE
jgi:hypothetical protein